MLLVKRRERREGGLGVGLGVDALQVGSNVHGSAIVPDVL
jgi:hypothetical protein